MMEGGTLHVLLVEDSPAERWLMAEILRSRGHMVTACSGTASALESWDSERYPLVVLDLVLEDGTGLDVCRKIRRRPGGESAVIVVVTGRNDPAALEEVLAAGADDYVAKPFDVAMLNVRLAVAEAAVRLRGERARAEAALERANADVQSLFRNLGDVVFSVDLETDRLIQVSPAVEALLGLSVDLLKSRPDRWPDLFPGYTPTDVRERVSRVEGDRALVLAISRQGSGGEPLWLEASIHAQKDARGRATRIDGVIADVTERRRVQGELSARNRELRTLHDISEVALESSSLEDGLPSILDIICRDTGFPIAIVEWEEKGGQALRLVAARGVPGEALAGASPIGLDGSLSGKAFRAMAPQSVVKADLRAAIPYPIVDRLGRGSVFAFPILVNGTPVGVLSLAHTEDVPQDARILRWGASLANYVASFTERVRAIAAIRENESRYRSLAEDLQRANQELEAFGYTVSHDLRAPLRTMQGFAHTLLQKFEASLPPEALDYTRRILASGEQAEQLIRDLLAYSKLTLKEVQRVPVELSVVVSTALGQLSSDIQEAGARVDVSGELPPVLGDHTTLVQVVSNLVSNAVKFVREGVAPWVRISAEPRGEEVRLWVEDNGVGIPSNQVEKIFRTFERLTQTQARPGTGIGLAIVRRGMERIGGTSGVEPGRGEGSRFWIQVPASGSA